LNARTEPVVLITGATSKTAEALARVLRGFGRKNLVFTSSQAHPPIYFDYTMCRLDVTSRKDVKEFCLRLKPDFIIHTAAFTNVDACETERQKAWTVNVQSVEYMVQVCRLLDAHLIHFSTDYVFDGTEGPYSEIAIPRPLGYYAKTKLASENVCLTNSIEATVIRTNVLYGPTQSLKPDFVMWVLRKLAENKPFSVVDDQYSNPTLIDDLAYLVEKVLQTRQTGLFHSGGSEWENRFQTAQKVATVFKLNSHLISPMSTASLQQAAPRPMKGGLIPLKAETSFGMKFSGVESGLQMTRRHLQQFGHREWAL
jgi:dTDP-4-dehydrorhamnose reductase